MEFLSFDLMNYNASAVRPLFMFIEVRPFLIFPEARIISSVASTTTYSVAVTVLESSVPMLQLCSRALLDSRAIFNQILDIC